MPISHKLLGVADVNNRNGYSMLSEKKNVAESENQIEDKKSLYEIRKNYSKQLWRFSANSAANSAFGLLTVQTSSVWVATTSPQASEPSLAAAYTNMRTTPPLFPRAMKVYPSFAIACFQTSAATGEVRGMRSTVLE